MQTHEPVIALKDAVLCMDCNNISESRGHSCVFCGSRAIMNVQSIIGHVESGATLQAEGRHPGFAVSEAKVITPQEAATGALKVLRRAKRRQQP